MYGHHNCLGVCVCVCVCVCVYMWVGLCMCVCSDCICISTGRTKHWYIEHKCKSTASQIMIGQRLGNGSISCCVYTIY